MRIAIKVWSLGVALLGCSPPAPSGSPSSRAVHQPSQQPAAVIAVDASGPETSATSSAPDAGARAAECERVSIGVEEPTPYGFTPNEVLTALHAAEQPFLLYEEHAQFFESVGLGARPAGHDEATFRFQPTRATYFGNCPPGRRAPSRVTIAGTVTATLSRGATFSAHGTVYFDGARGLPKRAFFNADTTAPPATPLQIVWELDSREPEAILNTFAKGHTGWRVPASLPEDAALTSRLGKFRKALTGLSGRAMRCTSTCGAVSSPEPDDARDASARVTYTGPAPTVAVLGLGGRLAGGSGSGRIVMEIRWPDDPRPIGLSRAIEGVADTPAQEGYRVVGLGSRKSALPPTLAKGAGCPNDESGDWSLFFEANPNAQSKHTARAVVTWSLESSGAVRCEF